MSDEAFLSRWSRLKRTAVKPEPVPEPPVVAEDVAEEEPLPVAAEMAPEADDPLADLPSIADLTGESDFTPFLRAEVPDDLHRQALRKLWTSDPVYANDDGLKDYADDYTGLFTGSDPVKTLYRVGRGFLTDLEEGEAETPRDALPPPALPVPDDPVMGPLPLPTREREGTHAEHGEGEGRVEDRDAARPIAPHPSR